MACLSGLILVWILVSPYLPFDLSATEACSTVTTSSRDWTSGQLVKTSSVTVETCAEPRLDVPTLIGLLVLVGVFLLAEMATLLPGLTITTPWGSASTPQGSKVKTELETANETYQTVLDAMMRAAVKSDQAAKPKRPRTAKPKPEEKRPSAAND